MAELTDNTTNMAAITVGVMSTYPGKEPDYDKQIEFVWYSDGDGMTAESGGVFNPILNDNLSEMTMDTLGSFITSELVGDNITSMTMESLGTFYLPGFRKHWVAWSNIGSLDFTIDRANVAGEMPLDWDGYVNNIHKLGSRVVAYGDNGVSILVPSGNAYGLNTIHRIGLKGRDAFAGNDFVHYFIDNLGSLYSLADTLEKLDYKEFLSLMTDPVLTWDKDNDLLYICDGTLGYIYSPDTKSLGAGPVNVTGIGSKGGVFYVASPAAITTPAANIVTDLYDFGTRKMKTIYGLEFGVDLAGVLQVAIESRFDKSKDLVSTNFVTVAANGKARIIKRGTDFRFILKGLNYEDFELDSFTVSGIIHVH